jgi:PRTRC genetic system protein E
MTDSIFTTLERVLLPHESLKFTILRQPAGLVLLMQPHLNDKAANVPKEAEQARAMLAVPLRLLGSAAQLDAAFAEQVGGYAAARADLRTGFDALLDAFKETTKETRAKATNAKGSVTKPSGAAPANGGAAPASGKADDKRGAAAVDPTPVAESASSRPAKSPEMQPKSLFGDEEG